MINVCTGKYTRIDEKIVSGPSMVNLIKEKSLALMKR